MTLKLFIQVILLVWFIATNAAILVPSYQLLFSKEKENPMMLQPPQPPPPPPAPAGIWPFDSKLDLERQKRQIEAHKQQSSAYAEQVKAYTQEVSAYAQQVAAYKAHEESKSRSSFTGVYQVVVKDSLIILLGSFATMLIGFVFANLGAGVVDNFLRMRNNEQPQPLKLF